MPAVTLQLMRCQNKIGDYYAAIAAFNGLGGAEKPPPEFHAELGVAYSALGDREKAVDAYRKALSTERKSILALRSLLELYVNSAADEDLRRLVKRARSRDPRQHRLRAAAGARLSQARRPGRELRACSGSACRLAKRVEYFPGWPVPEPRIRHDYEQLELLQQRGRLTESAALVASRVEALLRPDRGCQKSLLSGRRRRRSL